MVILLFVEFLNLIVLLITSLLGFAALSSGGLSVIVGLMVLVVALGSAICLCAAQCKKRKRWVDIVCICINVLAALVLLVVISLFHIPFLLILLPITGLNIYYFAFVDPDSSQKSQNQSGPVAQRQHKRGPVAQRQHKSSPDAQQHEGGPDAQQHESAPDAQQQLALRPWWHKWSRVDLVTASFLVLCVVGTLAWRYTDGFTLRFYSAAEINEKPSILTGKRLQNTVLSDLVLENVTIENAVFENVSFIDSQFTNTTFKNCTFILCSGEKMSFDRVLFEGGSIVGFANADSDARGPAQFPRPTSIFAAGKNFAVIFQAMTFGAVQFTNIVEGTVVINNCTFADKVPTDPLFTGRDTRLRMDNCTIADRSLGKLVGNSKAYITNSTLTRTYLAEKIGILYIDNCTATGLHAAPFIQVIKNSRVGLTIAPPEGGRAWLINNSYTVNPLWGTFEIFGHSNSIVHIIGKENELAKFKIYSGTVFIENISLLNSSFGLGWESSANNMPRIHLKNVDMKAIALNNTAMQGGTWQDVRLYPEILTSQGYPDPLNDSDTSANSASSPKPALPEAGPLLVHNLTFPKGNPWGESTIPPTMVVSPTPLPWTDVQVPTAKGLGLEDIPLSWTRE